MKFRVLGMAYLALSTVGFILALQRVAVGQDATTVSAHSQYKLLYAFPGQNAPGGAVPDAYVIPDAEGNLYGTTTSGGAPDFGVVFKLNASGSEQTVLHAFTFPADGDDPLAGLTLDSTGAVYGTTIGGGLPNPKGTNFGTVFKVDATGIETVLHSFDGSDGAFPAAAVVRDAAGNVYSTTIGCRASGFECPDFYGEVFKLDTNRKLIILHRFSSESPGSDGAIPESGLVQDGAGNLYGTTLAGGTAGHGTVYKIDAKGKHTVLHSFTGGRDGKWPVFGNLILDAAGNLYGTTSTSTGVIFRLSPAGKFTTLYSFRGEAGGFPNMPLARDAAGNLYGTTLIGGDAACDCGTIFKLDISGNLTVLHNFASSTDGAYPMDGLIVDAAGSLYGTTQAGGDPDVQCGSETTGCGAVFKFTP
jgi:uncharacterized repeat protein (TIGR03803 family)